MRTLCIVKYLFSFVPVAVVEFNLFYCDHLSCVSETAPNLKKMRATQTLNLHNTRSHKIENEQVADKVFFNMAVKKKKEEAPGRISNNAKIIGWPISRVVCSAAALWVVTQRFVERSVA